MVDNAVPSDENIAHKELNKYRAGLKSFIQITFKETLKKN